MKSYYCLNSSVQLGAYTLPNRLVITSKSRSLAHNNLPQPEAINYYTDKATCGLIITEPTLVSPVHTLSNQPGIYTHQQVRSWRKITESVRDKNGKIFLRLWYGEKIQHPIDNNIISLFRRAAQNALAADFDGVEICADFSDLIAHQSQYCSKEEDNQTQLLLSIIEEAASVWDENKVGIELPINSCFLKAKSSFLILMLYRLIDAFNFYNLAYLHIGKSFQNDVLQNKISLMWLKSLHSIYSGTLIVNCQNISQTEREKICQYSQDLVSFYNLSKLPILDRLLDNLNV